MIVIVDYGIGNIAAFANIYKSLGVEVALANSPQSLNKAKKIILPGVGSFDWAMTALNNSGMRESLEEAVLVNGVPILGVCVGMQMMAQKSQEGELDGLGWFDATVNMMESSHEAGLPLPHMGWNDISVVKDTALSNQIDDARFYFLHSYSISLEHSDEMMFATTYERSFASGINRQNIFGVQFHPEKSHGWGVRLLKDFAELA